MKKILITGGAGYIGSVLTPKLLQKGYQVTVLDSFLFKQNTLLDCCKNDNFTIINADCRDESVLKKAITDAEYIIPLAAIVGAPLSSRDKNATISVNLEAIKLLNSVSSKDQKIILPTTNSGYGVGEQNRVYDENSPLNPISLYGSTKVEAEKIIIDRENSISFRFATVFGLSARMRLDLLVNDFTYRAFKDRSLILFESHFKRNFLHIQDAANSFIYAIENFEKMKNNIFNVGISDANLSKKELCEKIKKYINNFVYFEAQIGEDPDKRNYIVSNDKIESFGFKTSWSVDDGIQELIKGYNIINNSIYSNY